MKITYRDESGAEQPLVRSEWQWPTDRGNFQLLYNMTRDSASAVTDFHARRKSTTISVSPAEQAEATRKGPGAFEKLYSARRTFTDNLIASEQLKLLAVREGGPSTSLFAIESSFPTRVNEMARVEAWTPVSVAVDRWAIEQFARLDGAKRTEFLQRLRNGQHVSTARALLRVADAAPELLPPDFDIGGIPVLREALARSVAPEGMAEIDGEKRAAIVARATWAAAVSTIREGVTLTDDEVHKALGGSMDRLKIQVPIDDENWPLALPAARHRSGAPAPVDSGVKRAELHLEAAARRAAS